MATAGRYIGKPLKRKEDPRLIQGLSHYVDDLHATILSPLGIDHEKLTYRHSAAISG